MSKLTLTSEIKSSKLQANVTRQILAFIKPLESKFINITIEKVKNKRSAEQNAYYWGCVIPIVKERIKELGDDWSNEQVHEELKRRFLTHDFHIKDGQFIQKTESSRNLTKVEFMEYIDKIQQFATEVLDIYIPSPNEQVQIEY